MCQTEYLGIKDDCWMQFDMLPFVISLLNPQGADVCNKAQSVHCFNITDEDKKQKKTNKHLRLMMSWLFFFNE